MNNATGLTTWTVHLDNYFCGTLHLSSITLDSTGGDN